MDYKQIQTILAERHRELETLGVKSLSLFGSMVRGEARPDSDVDILVEFEGEPDFDTYMDLKFFLEDLLNRRVDLVTTGALKPRMRLLVEKEAIRVA